jgi:hypothetical protein
MALDFGCIGVLVDARPGAESYHTQFGFIPLETAEAIPARMETAMFLAIGKIEAAGR